MNNTVETNQRRINVDLSIADDVTCEECGSSFFVPAFMIKRVSPVVSPTGEEMMVPVQLFKCSDCGHVNEAFRETPR